MTPWILEVDVVMADGRFRFGWDVPDESVGLRHAELNFVGNNDGVLFEVVLNPDGEDFNDKVNL